jgi:pre-mRNA-processing factor 19
MEKLNQILSEQRKSRKAPADYPKKEGIKRYTELGSYPLHESTKPGIIDLDIHPVHEQFVVSVGKD